MLFMYICMWGSAIIIVFAVINACFLYVWPVAKKKKIKSKLFFKWNWKLHGNYGSDAGTQSNFFFVHKKRFHLSNFLVTVAWENLKSNATSERVFHLIFFRSQSHCMLLTTYYPLSSIVVVVVLSRMRKKKAANLGEWAKP